MFISTSPAPLPVIQATPEPRVAAPQPVKAPNFANLLRQTRAATAPVKPPEPAAPDAAAEPAPADEGTPTASPNALLRNRTAGADKSQRAATKPPAKTAPHDGEAEATEPGKRSSDSPTTADTNPLLAQLLSHLHRPIDTGAEKLGRGTDASNDEAAGTQEGAALALQTRANGTTGNGRDSADSGQASLAAAADASAQRSDAAALIESASAEAKTSRNPDALPTPIDASAATPSAASSFAASVASAAQRPAEAMTVAISTPVAAPDFSQVLGVQLSVLAKDGIQHAELHLNPADMGPVSVQIELNGTQAHIDFGADVAATRHAIEAGLPELASALRDAGFTLSGGGVSQHSRGGSEPGGDGDGPARRNGRANTAIGAAGDGAASASNALRRQGSLGGLDLYA